jgi:hypothetical protein
MLSKTNRTWLFLVSMIMLTVLIIDTIDTNLPPGKLSTELMLGAVIFGFGSQFIWLYHQHIK